jgi:hypothetical protein
MMGVLIYIYWMTPLHTTGCYNLLSSDIADTASIRYSTRTNEAASAPKHHTMKAQNGQVSIALCFSTK